MEHIWIELYNTAKAKLNPHKVSEWVEAGGVAAAIEGVSGRIYTGVAWTAPACLASALSATATREPVFPRAMYGRISISAMMLRRWSAFSA